MTVLEKSIINLASALENLEAKLDGRLDDHSAGAEQMSAMRRQTHAAHIHIKEAGSDLSGAIGDLRGLLDNYDATTKD